MKTSNGIKIIFFVLATAVILGVITWKTANYLVMPGGYPVKAQFRDVDGVALNAPVMLNGFEVGRVKDIRILYGEATRVELSLFLQQNAKLRQGATAMIKNLGFMGEKYVALTTGDDGAAFLPPDSVLQGQEPVDFQKVLVEGQQVATNLKEISQQINGHLKTNSQAIDDILADSRTTMKNMASISSNVNERLGVNKDQVDDTITRLNEASKNLDEMSLDLKENPWKLLYKPRMEKKIVPSCSAPEKK